MSLRKKGDVHWHSVSTNEVLAEFVLKLAAPSPANTATYSIVKGDQGFTSFQIAHINRTGCEMAKVPGPCGGW